MNQLISLLRGNRVALAVLALFVSTQVTLQVANPFSVNGYKALNLAEIPLMVLSAWVLFQLAFRGGWQRLTKLGRTIFVLTCVSVATWAGMVMLRKVVEGKLVVAVTVVEYLVFSVAAFLATELLRLNAVQIIRGMLAFLTATNLWAIGWVLAGETVREMGLLGNINFYVGVALMVVPMLTVHGARTRHAAERWLVIANLGLLFSLVILSGSRFGGLAIICILGATLVLVHPSPWRTRLAQAGAALGIAVAVFAGLVIANPAQLSDVGRTFNIMSVVRGEEPDTKKIEEKHKNDPKPPPKPSEQDRFTTAGDPDHDPIPEGLNILNHTRVTKRSLAVVGEHWLLGIGRIGPYFSGWGYHPAHNVVLELILYQGMFGALPWLTIILSGVVGAWRAPDRKAWVLGFAALFAFAQLQPLLTDSLSTLLPLWLLLGATRNLLLHRREPGRGATAVAPSRGARIPATAGRQEVTA